ncbi:hypothetical protein SBRY_30314 [Actinacidiphila bryophytorum]|uniref:Uncharacterized protein n=1 Tax=Actinacidiphila bryophytorum TaxID=1436133 RepID=A0A9W4H0U6_9ACTN|nr:hypothetical protein SBRY_30314 [Actinacidiphila bryophytorum]
MDRRVLARCPGARRHDRRVRQAHPGVLRPADGDRQLAEEPDVQHARAGHALPAQGAAGVDQRAGRPELGDRAHRRLVVAAVRLGGEGLVRYAVRDGPLAALPGRRHHRLRGRHRRHRGGQGSAGQRHRGHRALPQAGPQPAAGGDVPGRRAVGRRGADRLHRLRHRSALTR